MGNREQKSTPQNDHSELFLRRAVPWLILVSNDRRSMNPVQEAVASIPELWQYYLAEILFQELVGPARPGFLDYRVAVALEVKEEAVPQVH